MIHRYRFQISLTGVIVIDTNQRNNQQTNGTGNQEPSPIDFHHNRKADFDEIALWFWLLDKSITFV